MYLIYKCKPPDYSYYNFGVVGQPNSLQTNVRLVIYGQGLVPGGSSPGSIDLHVTTVLFNLNLGLECNPLPK
jgi:hypothetical protein